MAPEIQTIPPIRLAGEFAGHSRRLDSHRCRSLSTFDMRSHRDVDEDCALVVYDVVLIASLLSTMQ
jgi:hypothetical protein